MTERAGLGAGRRGGGIAMQGWGYWGNRWPRPLNRRRFVGGAVMTGAAALAACGGGKGKSGGGATTGSASGGATAAASAGAAGATPQPVKGGTLNKVITGDPPSFDMHQESTNLVNHVCAHIYNQLVQFDPSVANESPKTIIGDLADAWELSGDGLQYTFKLKQGVTYHDGKPFGGADVKATLERMATPPKDVVSPRGDSLKVIDRIEVPDSSTVVLHLARPAPSIISILAQGWMAIYSEKDIGSGFDFKLKTNGTGPFKLIDYVRGNRITLAASPSYFVKGQPYLAGVTVFVMVNAPARLAAFQSGQLQFSHTFGATDIKTLQGALGKSIVVQSLNGLLFSTINFGGRAPWRDERVRRAVSEALDRQNAIQLVAQGEGWEGGYMPAKGAWALSDDELHALPGYAPVSDQTIADAKALLAAAGVQQGHQTTILTRRGSEDLSTYIKDGLQKIGIVANPQVLEDAAAYDALNKRNFDLAPWGHGIALDDPDSIFSEFYLTGSPRNYSEISSKEVDDLFLKQSQTLDQQQRFSLVKELQRKALPLFGKIILDWTPTRWAWTNKLHGYTAHVGLYNNNRHAGTWLEKG